MQEHEVEVVHGPDRETDSVFVLAESRADALDMAEERAHERFGPQADIKSVA